MHRSKKIGRRILAVTALSAAGVGIGVSSPDVASAAFNDCSNERICLWSGFNYTGTRSQYTGSAGGSSANQLNKASRSFGNQKNAGGIVRFYRWDFGMAGWQSTLLASASPNTGNSWSGTRTVDQIS